MADSIAPLNERLTLLAPSNWPGTHLFGRASVDPGRYEALLAEMQRLRGKMYLQDGAIEEWQLTSSGRHCQEADIRSWHLLAMDDNGDVCGCSRYLHHHNTIGFDRLGVRHSAMAECDTWGTKLEAAIETELSQARENDLAYCEVGGWAIVEARRHTVEALRVALATYGLAQLLGGCLGISTVTVRHGSSRILRRIGGRSLSWNGCELPVYYDPQYKCEMEILRFDSRSPHPKYVAWTDHIKSSLLTVSVICRESESYRTTWQNILEGMELAGAGQLSLKRMS